MIKSVYQRCCPVRRLSSCGFRQLCPSLVLWRRAVELECLHAYI